MKIRAGILKRIHVNGHTIRANKQTGKNAPVYTIKCVDGNYYASDFQVHGPLRAVQNFTKPLKSGAVVWLETRAAISLEPVHA